MNELEQQILNGYNSNIRDTKPNESLFKNETHNLTKINIKQFASLSYKYEIDLKTLEGDDLRVKQTKSVSNFQITLEDLDQFYNDEPFTINDKQLKLNNIIEYLITNPIVFTTKFPVLYSGTNVGNTPNKLHLSCRELKLIQGQSQINQIIDYVTRNGDNQIIIPITIISTAPVYNIKAKSNTKA
jgi:hypothetical protein